jgi:hypothetical protein
LKDGIPLPVADNCCVSGVKTEEAVAGILRKPPVMTEEAVTPDRAPKPAVSPPPPPGGKGEEKERIPRTGSGKRIAAVPQFTAVPPAAASRFVAGAGRVTVEGNNYTAVPRAASAPVSRAATDGKFPVTGKGLRKIEDVRYTGTPPTAPAGTSPSSGGPLPGGAMRIISGVDISAVPPRR